jgi:septal ring factor EnvC (AmiA/AmiB activator)
MNVKRPRFAIAATAASALLVLLPVAKAQDAGQNPESAKSGQDIAESPEAENRRNVLIDQRGKTLLQMDELTRSLSVSTQQRAQLENEIANLKQDEAAVSAALLKAAKAEDALNGDIGKQKEVLIALEGETATLHASLIERSAVLAEVLAALQRLGLNPPPALLVTPQDALASVRSSVLLGAVVPAMRLETLALKADLDRLAVLSTDIKTATADLTAALQRQIEDRARLDLLLEEKRRLGASSAEALAAEAARAKALQGNLASLKALLGSIDDQIADVEKAANARRVALEKSRTLDPGSFSLGPSVQFVSLKGQLPLPVSGSAVLRFGEKNTAGIVMNGDTIRTRSAAIVTAPADAVVAFAAPFRSYGQLVILDTGAGYKMVIGGLAKLGVTAGQTVLAGEPLGVMAAQESGDATSGSGPELYVELRKDGQAVNPASWWKPQILGLQNDDT